MVHGFSWFLMFVVDGVGFDASQFNCPWCKHRFLPIVERHLRTLAVPCQVAFCCHIDHHRVAFPIDRCYRLRGPHTSSIFGMLAVRTVA